MGLSVADFEGLTQRLGLSLVSFDLVIVADGSGTKPDTPCGAAAASFYIDNGHIDELREACSHGTNNYAELAPFLTALRAHLAAYPFDPVLEPNRQVLCVTDSEVTAKCGSGEYRRNANQPLWAALDWYADNGFEFTWRWIPRNSVQIHKRCDEASRASRLHFEGMVCP